MSDHAILMLSLVVAIVFGIIGNVILALMLRECQRLTRSVAGLVYQETDKLRSLLGGR